MDVKGNIETALKNALLKLGLEADVVLDHPAELTHGDYSCNVALAAAKKAGKNPKVLADEIMAEVGVIEGVESVSVAGAGFLNFKLAKDFFPQATAKILEQGEKWGGNDHVKGYKVMVEYTDPNAFKPLHIGHLMSNAIGESIARLVEFSGGETKKANYASDIGLNVAKGVWGAKKIHADLNDLSALGKAYATAHEAYETNPEAKEEIDVVNKALYEDTDSELSGIRKKGVATSLKHLYEICDVLGTRFDFEFLESQSAPLGKKIVLENTPNVFEISEGATVYKGEADGLHTRVFLNSRGLPTYEAKDIGLIGLKQSSFPFDLSIIVTSVEQKEYFKVVKAAAEKLYRELKGRLMHVPHGFLTLTTGKMSSRKGNVITGESLIQEMREAALQKMEGRDLGNEKQAIADAVAVGAIKYSILKQASGKNIIFDPEASLSFEGDSGPYLQYAHVRARAILRRAEEESVVANAGKPIGEVTTLEKLLYRFPEVVFRSAKENEPHHVTTYLTELASVFNSWYAGTKIVDANDTGSPYRVALTQAFALTMKNGLWLLGIQAPEKM